jgi:hypothetical protein
VAESPDGVEVSDRRSRSACRLAPDLAIASDWVGQLPPSQLTTRPPAGCSSVEVDGDTGFELAALAARHARRARGGGYREVRHRF